MNDLIILTKNQHDYNYIRDELSNSFKMKDLGLLHYSLFGHRINAKKGNIIIAQKICIDDNLCKFIMQDSKSVITTVRQKCLETEQEKSEMKIFFIFN